MVTETIKTGYWRINPATGGHEWIAGSYQPKKPKLEEEEQVSPLITSRELYEFDVQWEDWWKEYQRTGRYPEAPAEERFQPYYEQWLQKVKAFEIEQLPIVRPEVPTADVTEIAEQYGLWPGYFVTPEQLADIALPPEERAVRWQIPYEQYLTSEQAKWLGYDVPEGAVIRMTPMAEGEPSLFLMPEPVGVPQLPVELENTLRNIYPEMFDPAASWGYSPDEIPAMVVEQIGLRIQRDFQSFVADLYARVGEYEAERILKLFGVTEEFILLALDYEKQEERFTDAIQPVFPDFGNLEDFGKLIETDFGLFMETMQTGGSSIEKRRLLEEMGYKPEEINQIFSVQRVVVPVDGIRKLVTWDTITGRAYDEGGKFVGSYNPITKEFTEATFSDRVKDFVNTWSFASIAGFEKGKGFFLSVLPQLLFRDMSSLERKIQGDEWADETDRRNKAIRETFRAQAAESQREYEDWVVKHPELKPNPIYEEGPSKHPELWGDPNWWAYEVASMAPLTLTAMATGALATIATGGNIIVGAAVAGLTFGPVETQAVYEDLLSEGVPEDQAAELAMLVGVPIVLTESLGTWLQFTRFLPQIRAIFRREATKQIVKLTTRQLVKKGLITFSTLQFTETMEEVIQQALGNTAVIIAGIDRSLFKGIPELIPKITAGMLPFSLIGAGVSLVRVSPSQTQGLSDAQMRAKGWVKDNIGNWYEAIRDERGFVRLPGEPEGVGRAERERLELVKKDKVRIEREIEEGTIPKAVGNKQIESLNIEIANLEQQIEKLPTPEAGMPEAGIQPAMIEGVPARKVRPPAKAEIVQISMEDQLKLDQARQATEEAPEDVREAYEAQAEITGLKITHETDPVATAKFKLGGKNVSLTAFISIREQTFPEYFTVKQAQALYPALTTELYTQPGTPQYNRVPRDVALDDLAKQLNMTPDEIADRVMAIRQEKNRIQQLEANIATQMTEKPLAPRTELTTTEVTENWTTLGQPKLTLKQAQALAGFFGDYVLSENAVTAWELTRELRRETMAGRAEILKARAQELIITQGLDAETGMKQAIKETLSGELPVVPTEYFQDMSNELRSALFAIVFHNKAMQQYPLEMASTVTALTNALTGRPIPRERGTGSILFPEGGSAWDRLAFVFGPQTRTFKAIEKMAKEGKTTRQIVEALYEITGKEPIPIDQATADYLRGLTTDILYQPTVLLEPIPVTPFEAPIEDAFKQMPLMPRPAKEKIVAVLKELGMSPVDIGNFLRANKASVDFSFWRQQAPLIAAHPLSFVQANIEAWNALWSQKATDASWQRITRDPLYQIYEECERQGGDFLRPVELLKGAAQYRGTEEYGYYKGVERVIPRLTGKLPWIKLSARAFETGTNVHNWLIFKGYHRAMLNLSEQYASGQKKLKAGEVFDITKEMVDFSKMLANFSGRGSLGKFQATAPILSGFFFAPRYAIGRLVSPKHLLDANPRVRLEAWKNAATFVSVFGGIVLLGAQMDWWEVETDPQSAEYMSVRIGNVRIDPWGGYRQFLVFFARAITGTGVSSVTGAEYEADPINLIQTFIRGKAAPLASLILDFWRGKNFVGEEVDVANKKQWAERVSPFAVWDIYEAWLEDPKTAAQIAIPAIVGAGVQTYTGEWVENWTKLGLPKYSENLVYGLTEPYYDTADFWTDTSSQFKGVDPATLTKEKGFPDYIRAIAEARIINEHLSTLPNEKLVSLNADPAVGTTFAQYYQMWRDREKIVATGDEEKLKEFDQDERTRNAEKGNFSQRQFALLNQYWAITDKKKQAEFLKKHKADIGINPRQDWLRSHSKENAQLAVWGQAKILTKEAYIEFNRLIKELDIPDNAIPELTLPPETSIDTHFTYEEMVSEGTHSSVEADLLLLKDHLAAEEAGVQSYVDWRIEGGNPLTLSDKPVGYLQLRVDNQHLYDALEEAQEITTKADRDAAVEAVRATKVGAETFHDIERRVDAMGKGTREAPVPDEVVNAYVEHMRIVDETSGNSAEAKLNRYDNPDLNDFLMNEDYHGDNAAEALDENKEYLGNYLVPRWRIDVEFREEDAEYNEIPEDDREARDAYLAGEGLEGATLTRRVDYREDRRRREALEMSNKLTGERFPLDQIENFVAYHEIEVKGKRQERFLVENPTFADAMHNIAGIDIPKPEDVPSVEYDNIYDEWKDEFERWEGYSNHESEFYIEDADARKVAYDAMKFTIATQTYSGVRAKNKQLTAFGLVLIKRDAYGKFVPEQYIETYVGYYKIIGEGKPENWKLNTGTDLWYEDDWFMMENIEFYREVYRDLLGNEKRDFSKVPSREVFSQYLTYIALPHLKAKDDFRWNHRELDAWLVLKFDYTPIAEKKRREELTTYERFIEEWAERGQAIEERLKALRGE